MSITGSNNAGVISKLINWELVYRKGIVTVGTNIYSQDILVAEVMDYRGRPYKVKTTFVHDLIQATQEEKIKVVGLDCCSIREVKDAIGWKQALLDLSPQDKPSIVVLENITELKSLELQDILIHSWRGETNYLVYLVWDTEQKEDFDKLWNPEDKFKGIDNYEAWRKVKEAEYKSMPKVKITEIYNKLNPYK